MNKKIKKIGKEIGIEQCEDPKDVKIFFHPKSLKMWASVAIMLGTIVLGSAKIWDGFWYDFLEYPRNNQEMLMDHFTLHHLLIGDKPIIDRPVDIGDDSKVLVQKFQDKCVGTCYVKLGIPIGYNLYSPDIDRIKKLMSTKIGIKEVHAGGYNQDFDMGEHSGDTNYTKERWKSKRGVEYAYKYYHPDNPKLQDCVLRFYVNRHLEVRGKDWEVYNHR